MAATTQFGFREYWRELRSGRPGHRFQARYERARRSERRTGAWQRFALMGLALVFAAIGAVLAVIPGPAFPFFILAGGLLATESRPLARFMDWSEVMVRKVLAWGKRRWRRLPTGARIALIVIGACCSASITYLSYRFIRG